MSTTDRFARFVGFRAGYVGETTSCRTAAGLAGRLAGVLLVCSEALGGLSDDKHISAHWSEARSRLTTGLNIKSL